MPLSVPASDLLPRVPQSALTVLDVGCGSGELAAAYRRINPRARLIGIEPDPDAALLAAAHLDQVSITDLEADPLPVDASGGIDCIIYNDVLQRLRKPWELIRRQAKLLSADGVVLICVPSIDYWRLTERRLRGVWDDDRCARQHEWDSRCFSHADLNEQIRRTGLTFCDIAGYEPDADAAKSFADALAAGLTTLGINNADYARRAAASHLICRARKEPARRMVLSGTMLAPVGGVSHVRVVHPLQAASSDPAVTAAVTDQLERNQVTDKVPRIVVLHRPTLAGQQGLDHLRAVIEAGYLVVTEFDDHPDHFQMMRLGGDVCFLGVHALQTSTTAMAEILRQYNPEVAVFPNAVVSLPEVRNFADPRCLTLFFGALNREQDWRPLMPAINAVAAKAGAGLKFQVVHDQLFFAALATEHKAFTPTCDYDAYLRLLGQSELSFMPLADTAFNRAKSDLKFIEAGACRSVAVASSVVYGDSIEHGSTGLLFRDPSELYALLLRLLANPELARSLGDAARRYVANHRMLAYQVAPRIAWYRSLWTRRERLGAARQVRIQRRVTGWR